MKQARRVLAVGFAMLLLCGALVIGVRAAEPTSEDIKYNYNNRMFMLSSLAYSGQREEADTDWLWLDPSAESKAAFRAACQEVQEELEEHPPYAQYHHNPDTEQIVEWYRQNAYQSLVPTTIEKFAAIFDAYLQPAYARYYRSWRTFDWVWLDLGRTSVGLALGVNFRDLNEDKYPAKKWDAFESGESQLAYTAARNIRAERNRNAANPPATPQQHLECYSRMADIYQEYLDGYNALLAELNKPVECFRLWGKTTKWEKTPLNWFLLIVCFGWIWMVF